MPGRPLMTAHPSLLEPARFPHDAGVDDNDIGIVSGGDHNELALAAAFASGSEPEEVQAMDCCARVLMALGSHRGASSVSCASDAHMAEGSACSTEAACSMGRAASDATRPVAVPPFSGLSRAAAPRPFALSAAQACALRPARLIAIGQQPVVALPGGNCSWPGRSASCADATTRLGVGWDSNFGSSHAVALASSVAHLSALNAPPGLQGNVVRPPADSALPFAALGGGLQAGLHSGVLQLPEPPAIDLSEEERRMAHIDEPAASARLRFEAFGQPVDSLAQPSCSSGGGGRLSPALQDCDADTDRCPSRLAPRRCSSSERQTEEQQPCQQPTQQHGSLPLPLPIPCSTALSESACSPPAGQPAGNSTASNEEPPAGEGPPAGPAQQDKQRQPAVKRKYQPSKLTLQILEKEGLLDMDQIAVGRYLGFCSPTMVKKQMKRWGMMQWPYRTRVTCRGMVESAETYIAAKAELHCGPAVQVMAARLLTYVRQLYAKVLANPLGLCYANCPAAACKCKQLTREQSQLRQSLYKLRCEADAIEASGRWAQRIQQVVQRHCKELGLDGLEAGHDATAQALPMAEQSGSNPAGRSGRVQPERAARKPH